MCPGIPIALWSKEEFGLIVFPLGEEGERGADLDSLAICIVKNGFRKMYDDCFCWFYGDVLLYLGNKGGNKIVCEKRLTDKKKGENKTNSGNNQNNP